MAKNDSKRYYWLKLRTDFLDSEEVDYLLSLKEGSDYVVIYLQLCKIAINTNGKLARMLGEIYVPFDLEKITRDLKHWKIDTVRMAIELFKRLGYVGVSPEGVIVINEFQELVGSESAAAAKKRIQRQKKQQTKQIEDKVGDIVQDNVRPESKSHRVIESKSLRVKEKMNPLSESSSKRKDDEVEEEVKEKILIGTKILIENGIIKDESHLVEEFNEFFKALYEEHNKLMVNRILSNIVSYAKFREIKNPFKYIQNAIYNEIEFELNNSKRMPPAPEEKNVNQKESEQISEEEIENLKKELENL